MGKERAMITPNCDMPNNDLLQRIGDESYSRTALAKEIAYYFWRDHDRASDIKRILAGDFARALRLFEELLPGWAYKVSRCSLSDDAWAIPDPHDARHIRNILDLAGRVHPSSVWKVGVDVEVRPPRGELPAVSILALTVLATNLIKWRRDLIAARKRGKREVMRALAKYEPYETQTRVALKKAIRQAFGVD